MHCTADGGKLCLLSKIRVGASLFSGSLLIDEQSRGYEGNYVIGKPAAALSYPAVEELQCNDDRGVLFFFKTSFAPFSFCRAIH